MAHHRSLRIVPFLILTALLLFATTDRVAAEIGKRVVGAVPADRGAFPWMVALVSRTNEQQFCAGTVIGPRHVLTAAHCVFAGYDLDTGSIETIPTSRYAVSHRSGSRSVLDASIHPRYNAVSAEVDVAVLELAESLPGPYVKLAGRVDSPGDTVMLGWDGRGARIEAASSPARSDDACSANLGSAFKPGVMMCAGELARAHAPGVHLCHGASGGPLLVHDGSGGLRQIGVASWGMSERCAGPTYGVFAEVGAFLPFLNEMTGTLSGNPS